MNNQNGAIAVLTAILLTVLLGFVALSVDTGYLFASKNELQNAADAGALAGARELYKEDGTGINEDCNKVAYNAATQNLVAKDAIEIIGDGLTNVDDIQRGHWSFATRTFTQSDNTTLELTDDDNNFIPKDVLDADVNFVNAVQVTVRRETDPITLFFAKILGQSDAKMSATAVAYIGFVGTFFPAEFDAPVALCVENLIDPSTTNTYDCGLAVWYEHGETAMWTNLSQETKQADGNCESANANDVKSLIDTGNTATLYTGTDLGVTNGMVDIAQSKLSDIWETKSTVDDDETHRKVVTMTLPVIKCKDELGQTNTCAELVGGVVVELLWFNSTAAIDKAYEKAPYIFDDLDGNEIFNSSNVEGLDETDHEARWNAFASDDDVELLDDNGNPLPMANNQIYFRASCETAMEPTGGIGGENFGLLSKTPVLVD